MERLPLVVGGSVSGYGTAKHRLFAKYLADGLSQTDAFVKAGFKDKSPSAGACRLIQRNDSILQWRDEYLAEKAKVHEQALKIAVADKGRTFEALMDDLYKVKNMAMGAEAVLDSQGNATGEYRVDNANAIKAIVTIGQQAFGAFIAKSQSVPADPRDLLTDEEVRKLKADISEPNPGGDVAGEARQSAGVSGTTHRTH